MVFNILEVFSSLEIFSSLDGVAFNRVGVTSTLAISTEGAVGASDHLSLSMA